MAGQSSAPNNASIDTSAPTLLSAEDEDALIQRRLLNDERPVRRILKKFHQYTALANAPQSSTATEDARESFLNELDQFGLGISKSVRVCKAEAAQVEIYKRESARIRDEHGSVGGQIEQLKTQLEHAQVIRRHKMEYDTVAERINTLPSRSDLEDSIQVLENEMAEIRAEQELHTRLMRDQKAALGLIVSGLRDLRMLGKERIDPSTSHAPSPRMTPGPDVGDAAPSGIRHKRSLLGLASTGKESGEVEEDKEDGEGDSEDVPLAITSRLLARLVPPKGEDIEMGEVSEGPSNSLRGKKNREDLEEGEASDGSSDLSDVPDDA